jgi:hypothetical protein
MTGELGLTRIVEQWRAVWMTVPDSPHIKIIQTANPTYISALLKTAAYFKLPPEDIALIEAEPSKQQRYVELVVHTMVPPLRALSTLFDTQMHLYDPIAPERFDSILPNALGLGWRAALGSLSAIIWQAQLYIRQLEAVVARWGTADYSLLQPAAAWPYWALAMFHVELKKAAGVREIELLGVSSGSRAAAGSSNIFQTTSASAREGASNTT